MREIGWRTAVVYGASPLAAEGLDDVLSRSRITVTARATDAEDVTALVAELHPDLLLAIAEASDPGRALECVRRGRAASAATQAVVIGRERERERIDAAFAAGATVYCLDTARTDDIATAIRQVFERSIYFAPPPPRRRAEDTAPARAPGPKLTRREREILELVAEGFSNAELARMLHITEQTVKFHLSNVYRKLGVSNRTEASRWAQLHALLPRRPRHAPSR